MSHFPEPPIQPDDTSPSQVVRPVRRSQTGTPILAWAALLGAAAFTVGTVALLLFPSDSSVPAIPTATQSTIAQNSTPIDGAPTTDASVLPTSAPVVVQESSAPPTLDAARIDTLLAQPLLSVSSGAVNPSYDPFTVIKGNYARSEFVDYTIVRGDTIDAISKRYNLKSDSIAWCNNRRIVFVLRIGDTLSIPPVDGACHTVLGTKEETASTIAQQFKVADPNVILEFPLNNLSDRQVTDKLPGGLKVFIPGGEGEPITWNPGTDVEKNADGTVRSISFAPGQAGSCGKIAPQGGSGWTNPLPNARWVRGFYAGHTGLDLSANLGTPIFAANSGPVLFSGFSTWGYGETIVLAHGIYSSLYGHMSQRNLSCGDFAAAGSVIGLVGSTGNSSGPHLHFEIRVNDVPQNPSGTPGLGW
jgi:murein DD-endopeptidase MepM/ murein hydrolase activator NlpD